MIIRKRVGNQKTMLQFRSSWIICLYSGPWAFVGMIFAGDRGTVAFI